MINGRFRPMKRKFSFTLALLLATGIFSQACGSETDVSETLGTSADSATVSAETDYLDSLGAKDFKGATYTIRAQNSTGASAIFNMHCGEINGEVVNDAQFNRDKAVEQRYNVEIEYIISDDATNGQSLVNSMLAGDSIGNLIVDALSEGTGRISILFNNNMLANLLDVPYLQPQKEWWSQLMYENLTINDKLYFTSGDLAPFSYIGPACIYMNLELAGNYGIDENELFAMVYDGTWTMDKLYSMTKDADNDLNNDGKLDCINDFFGIVNENNTLTSTLLLATCGVKLSEYNEETGMLEVNLGTPDVFDKIDRLSQLFKTIDNQGDNTNLFDKNFKLDKSIFALHYVESTIRRLRDMESDYVIYPMPKYDETQDTYVSFINPWVAAFIAIPMVQDDLEMTGFITEVLEYMSVENVRPAIYDVTLKGKALNNEDCKAMLDLIFSTTYLDFNANYKFGGVLDAVNQAIFFGQPFASAYASLETKLNADLEEFMLNFE